MTARSQPPRARFDELAVFVEVAEAGSIAAAARRLGVPKSTVGRAIARLEADLGTALVRRMATGPSLTESGRALLGLSAPHIAALRDVSSAIAREGGEIHGTVRVTAPSDIAQVVLGPLVAAFVARHPRVSVEVDASLRLVDLAGEGFDLALRVVRRTLGSSSLVARKLARLDMGLYASPTYLARQGTPRRPDELAEHRQVLLFGPPGRSTLVLEGPRGQVRVAAQGSISANDFYFVKEAIMAGAGVGPLPWFQASGALESGRLVRVMPDHRLSGNTAYLVHPPQKPVSPKLEAFKRFLLENAPRLLIEPEPTRA